MKELAITKGVTSGMSRQVRCPMMGNTTRPVRLACAECPALGEITKTTVKCRYGEVKK